MIVTEELPEWEDSLGIGNILNLENVLNSNFITYSICFDFVYINFLYK